MGNGTPLSIPRDVTRRPSFARQAVRRASATHSLYLGIDVPLLLIVITLLVFGLLMVYSASYDYSIVVLDQSPYYMFQRQLAWFGLGILALIVMTVLNYHHWRILSIPLMGLTLAGLIGVLLAGQVVNNAARTLLGGSGQPSELAKLATVIYLSVWLYSKREQLSDVSFGLIPLGLILGALGGLIFLEPDLSATATIFIMGGIMFFLAGGDLKQIAVILVVSVVFGWFIFGIHPTGRERMDAYLLGLNDLTLAPNHLARALEALVKGGWFGVGIGRADTKLLGLPVPPTDSIFAVIGEETGLLGAGGVVTLFVLLLWRGLTIANQAPDGLGKLLAAGLTIWISTEAFINMAVLVGLVPFAGNALPFISAGGSSLLVSMAAIGILLNISRQTAQIRQEEESAFDAVVDLRRRDRGRRVSRSRRS